MMGSAMKEHVRKHYEHHDGELLKLSDWSRQLVAWAVSGLRVKQSVVLIRSSCYQNKVKRERRNAWPSIHAALSGGD